MKILFIIGLVFAFIGTSFAAPTGQCACASVDTDIEKTYGSKIDSYGILRSPNCLPYRGSQSAINDGRIYAHVDYNSQSAWLLTADIYIKSCRETFDCVCTKVNSDVKSSYSESDQTLASLSSGQCVEIQGKVYNTSTETWIQVKDNKQWKDEFHLAGLSAESFYCYPCPPMWQYKKGTSPSSLHPAGYGYPEGYYGHVNANIGIIGSWGCILSSTTPTQSSAGVQLPGCPKIITRAEWGARQPLLGIGTLKQTPYYAFIHHGATASCHTREECVRMIQSYQNYHMDGHHWSDIGYSFVVGEDGNVYEGRGWDEIGAHTRNFNSIGLGFCVIGNFMEREPVQAAQDVLKKLIQCGVDNKKLTPTYTLLGHRDTNPGTLCPGDKFYSLIHSWKNYDHKVIASKSVSMQH